MIIITIYLILLKCYIINCSLQPIYMKDLNTMYEKTRKETIINTIEQHHNNIYNSIIQAATAGKNKYEFSLHSSCSINNQSPPGQLELPKIIDIDIYKLSITIYKQILMIKLNHTFPDCKIVHIDKYKHKYKHLCDYMISW